MSDIALTNQSFVSAAPSVQPNAAVRERDIRLDFFRGIAMFIILVAHIPSDWLALWIPARFGFSDATEMFVFCSGMASAIAFGSVYRNHGWLTGTSRVVFRVWQVYWAHIGLFFAVAALTALMLKSGWFPKDPVGTLNLYLFYKDPLVHLPALFTLAYVPNYFDILPMYLVVLAMMPLVVALRRVHLAAAVAFVVAVWLVANVGQFNLPAEPLSDRRWFFNPLGWQLIFFTGFAFGTGWIKPPPLDRRLVILAIVVVVVSIPFAYFRIINISPEIRMWRKEYAMLIDKSSFGILRYVHFLALAYLAVHLVGPKGRRLTIEPAQRGVAVAWGFARSVIVTVGQQSLAVFVFSMFIAIFLGGVFDIVGRSWLSMIWVNALGFTAIAVVAHLVAWFKKKPWTKKTVRA